MNSTLTSSLLEQLSFLETPLKPVKPVKTTLSTTKGVAKKPRKLTDYQVFITRTVIGMEFCKDGRAWARETKMCVQLFEKYGKEFMMWISLPYGKMVPSLAYFVGRDGSEFLSTKLIEYTLHQNGQKPITESAELAPNKLDEDVIVQPQKPRTLKDFLKYGQENC